MGEQLSSIVIKGEIIDFRIKNLFKGNEYIHLQFPNWKSVIFSKAISRFIFFSKIKDENKM